MAAQALRVENFNGWLPPSRVGLLRPLLQHWVNYQLQRKFTHVRNIEQDLSDSMVIVHLTAIALDLDIFNLPSELGVIVGRPANKEVMQQNVDTCFKLMKAKTGYTMTFIYSPLKIVECDTQACFTVLLTLTRIYYMRVLFERRGQAVKLFRDSLLVLIRETLARANIPIAYGPVTNLTTDWQDGMLLCLLLWTRTGQFDLHTLGDLDASERIEMAQQLALEQYEVPPLLGEGEAMLIGDGDAIPIYLSALMHGFDSDPTFCEGERDEKMTRLHEEVRRLKETSERLRKENARLQEELQRSADVILNRLPSPETAVHQPDEELLHTLEARTQELEVFRTRMADFEVQRGELQGQLATAVSHGRNLAERLRQVEMRLQGEHLVMSNLRGPDRDNGVEAPSGNVTIMFTDIEGSTAHWEDTPLAMAASLQMHNAALRAVIKETGGYEVKTEGDSFMVTFQSPKAAVRCALKLQEKLAHLSWPDALLESEQPSSALVKDSNGAVLFRGLRVRVGLHMGHLTPQEDPMSHRYDYFGQVVNRAARVQGSAAGGQILMSDPVYDAIRNAEAELEYPVVTTLGERTMKGIRDPVTVHQILPRSLAGRTFGQVEQAKELANVHLAERLQQEISSLRSAHDTLMKKLESIEARFRSVMTQAESFQAEVQRLKKEAGDSMPGERESIEKRLDQLARKHISGMAGDQQTLREELDLAKETMETMSDRTLQMESEVAHLQQIIVKLRTEGVTVADANHAASFLEMARMKKKFEEDKNRLKHALKMERSRVDQLSADAKKVAMGRPGAVKAKIMEDIARDRAAIAGLSLSDLDIPTAPAPDPVPSTPTSSRSPLDCTPRSEPTPRGLGVRPTPRKDAVSPIRETPRGRQGDGQVRALPPLANRAPSLPALRSSPGSGSDVDLHRNRHTVSLDETRHRSPPDADGQQQQASTAQRKPSESVVCAPVSGATVRQPSPKEIVKDVSSELSDNEVVARPAAAQADSDSSELSDDEVVLGDNVNLFSPPVFPVEHEKPERDRPAPTRTVGGGGGRDQRRERSDGDQRRERSDGDRCERDGDTRNARERRHVSEDSTRDGVSTARRHRRRHVTPERISGGNSNSTGNARHSRTGDIATSMPASRLGQVSEAVAGRLVPVFESMPARQSHGEPLLARALTTSFDGTGTPRDDRRRHTSPPEKDKERADKDKDRADKSDMKDDREHHTVAVRDASRDAREARWNQYANETMPARVQALAFERWPDLPARPVTASARRHLDDRASRVHMIEGPHGEVREAHHHRRRARDDGDQKRGEGEGAAWAPRSGADAETTRASRNSRGPSKSPGGKAGEGVNPLPALLRREKVVAA